MNQKFFNLPQEKQKAIIDAGFRVFSENTYKKSPMSAIAEEAGISKSLLFHYFINKKDLFFYLFDYAVKFMVSEMNMEELLKETDFFVIMNKSVVSKCKIMRQHLYLLQFSLHVYFEKDPSIIEDLEQKRSLLINTSLAPIFERINVSKFKNPQDLSQLMNIVMHYSEGYMSRKMLMQPLDIDEILQEFLTLMDFLKRGYYKEEYL
jgi:AcrR family transcriptional regulator